MSSIASPYRAGEEEFLSDSWGKSWRRILKAEYESTCFVCKRPVHIGHAIVYDGQRWIHVRCSQD
jgi:hypothetical protein